MAYTILENSAGVAVQRGHCVRTILVDSEQDLAALPEDSAAGSVAHTADMTGMWMKDNAGDWKKIGGEA